jgi:hypothetical protein
MADSAPPSLFEKMIQERVAARRAAGVEVLEEDIETLRDAVQQQLDPDSEASRMVNALRGGAAKEFKDMNNALGLPGALALFTAIINATPVSAKRRQHLLRNIQLPPPLLRDTVGTLKFTLPDREFALRGGECQPDHDLQAQLAKVEPLLTEEQKKTLKDQCGMIVYFTRIVYIQLLELNQSLLDEMLPKLGMALEELRLMGLDEANDTIYLRRSTVEEDEGEGEPEVHVQKWAPRFGLFVEDLALVEAGGGAEAGDEP